ncbi:MAG TPA: sugar nucleotide-binding protein [Sedimentisphaerales bacterium]|jgi:dTDP-4-dehydrorhamnose reductase|nr:sugar nucleotide-binding protein [Sedimentisphaerales bacterium]HNU29081.1 sugar nucleotide-binding protein [Sedimentisphaerales bacterium]
MTSGSGCLFTGGSGLLGSAFRAILPDAQYPSSAEFDVTNYPQMRSYLCDKPCRTLIHAAAFTSPPRVDRDPGHAVEVNIIGTAHVVRLCMEFDCRLIYISTDYVFQGDRGNYREEDALHPVNGYAWSKLGGECAVRMYPKGLIVRTTFGPDVFPYPSAFADQWTSREKVSVIARKIVRLLDTDVTGVIHIGSRRRTVLEYARSLDETRPVGSMSIHDVAFRVPEDTSLDCGKYDALVGP